MNRRKLFRLFLIAAFLMWIAPAYADDLSHLSPMQLDGRSTDTNVMLINDADGVALITVPEGGGIVLGDATPDVATTAGLLWYDSGSLKYYDGTERTVSYSAATTLDASYTSGNTITVDGSGNLEIDLSITAKMVEIANTFNGTQAAALTIDNESAGTNAITAGILFSTTGANATITNAIDATDTGITNAISVGANKILLTTGTIEGGLAGIDFTEFDVSATTGAITINDDGDAGSITIEGTVLDINDLVFVGSGEIKSAASSTLSLTADDAGTGEDLIVTADNISLTAVGLMTLSPDAALDTAIDLSAANIDHAIKIGDNTIDGGAAAIEFTAFSVDNAGAVVCTSLDAGSGDITTSGNLDVGQVLESAIAPSSGNLAIDAYGTGLITIGENSTGGVTFKDNVDFDVASMFSGTAGLSFNTGGTEIISSSTGDQLDIDAAVEIEMATTILDINLTDNSDILVTGTDKSFTIATTDGDVVLDAVGISNGDIIIGAGDDMELDAVGLLELNSSGGIISIGNDAIAQAVNVGTGAAARIVTIGNIASTETQIDGLLVDINANTSGITMDAGAASNFTTSAGDLTLQATAASVNINASETAADQIKLNAQGVIAGNAINLLTTNGGIILHANGANGDVSIDAADAFDMIAAGVFSIDGTGASNVTASTGNLTLATTTSGSLIISSAGIVDIDTTYPNAITINTADDSTADATAISDITITAGSKGAGTGDGGDIILVAGDTTGGVQGYIKISDDVLVATTEKIYFNDTATFINSPSANNIEIEAATGILLDGAITVDAGHDLTMGTGHLIGAGDSEVDGFRLDLVAATATTITAAQSGNVFYNTGAVQIELPEASASLGCYYTFVVANAANFDINPDDGDLILGLCDVAGDMMRSGVLGDSITIVATEADEWTVIGSSNTTNSADAWADLD